MRTQFAEQKKIVLSNLNSKKSFFSNLKADELQELRLDEILFDLQVAIAVFAAQGNKLYTPLMIRAGMDALRRSGSDKDFNINAPQVQRFLGDRLQKFSNINVTTARAIRAQLVEGMNNAETIDELAKRVRTIFDSSSTWRSLVIARTETVSAANTASLLGAQQSGLIEKKKWITSRDDDVRSTPYSHRAAEGETVALDDFFRATGEEMQAPATGSIAANNINCRCTMIYTTNAGEV